MNSFERRLKKLNINIPLKPKNVTWTDDQWKAIVANGKDILVAASAGSGKTAVLVERIIRKLTHKESPINIDELLVVTFTNASAAEMRHRIGEAIEKEIALNPHSEHLRKQLSLLNKASISTLHSFCLDVVRKYYYLTDLDPSFRIADDTEAQLLRDEAMEALLEEEYGKEKNEPFFQVVDMFTSDRNDLDLQNLIIDLYNFSISNPFPNQWLEQLASIYDVSNIEHVEQLPFMEPLLLDIELQLQEAKRLFTEALSLTKEPGGPYPRAVNYEDDLRIVDILIQAKQQSFDALYEAFQSIKFTTAKKCSGEEFIEELVDYANELRNNGKKIIQNLKDDIFSRKPSYYLAHMQEMKKPIETLIKLVQSFAEKFKELKREKALVDFSDLEHYCLQLLIDSNIESFAPSEIARAYKSQFSEILVDEYQDTNMVQETILKLISQPEEEKGNMFMVGDVKQSIYRFRLAEPNLFLGKYLRFTPDGQQTGLRIDLSKNFRSRKEVLDATNYIFKQIMGIKVGEIAYDDAAELKLGAAYPEETGFEVELSIINMNKENEARVDEDSDQDEGMNHEDLEQSQLEARYIAQKIKEMISNNQQVFDPKKKVYRPLEYKDIVILLRSFSWATTFMEEFKQLQVPSYANLSTGYFDAIEVSTMLSLLKVIDNPYQDIPFVSVLRSPIVGLDEEELAVVRIKSNNKTYFESVKHFIQKTSQSELEEAINEKLVSFLSSLNKWRSMARQGGLSELIWELYRETNYYDYVGGLPGGKQRQANLRALYDRAKQYEATSFRGLFRFLRFVERMRDRGEDLGTAKALGEQENVVRLMTIHSSKGLEFPVVFVAGLGKKFNDRDIYSSFLIDKEFGFATKYVDVEKQISYTSLPQLAFSRKKRLELIAEEMRVLYVALTRAKEKLYLVGSVTNFEKNLQTWNKHLHNGQWLISDYDRYKAKSYLDWIGPAIVRHHQCTFLEKEHHLSSIPDEIRFHSSQWKTNVISRDEIVSFDEITKEDEGDYFQYVKEFKTLPIESEYSKRIVEQLSWVYPFHPSVSHRAKQSVSELKRLQEIMDENSSHDLIRSFKKPITTRPKFMQKQKITPAEIGTAMHLVMQQLDYQLPTDVTSIQRQLENMVRKELLTEEQMEVIQIEQIAEFFQTNIGQRLLKAKWYKREIPFSYAIKAEEIYKDWKSGEEKIFIQGIIDCLFEDDDGLVLLDYKTDNISDRFKGDINEAIPVLKKRYEVQLHYYTKAIEDILQRKVTERYLYFFDGSHLITI